MSKYNGMSAKTIADLKAGMTIYDDGKEYDRIKKLKGIASIDEESDGLYTIHYVDGTESYNRYTDIC